MVSFHRDPLSAPAPIGCWLLWAAFGVIVWGYGGPWAFTACAALVIVMQVRYMLRQRAERRRGWTVARPHPEVLQYGIWCDGSWQWLAFFVPGGGPTALVGEEVQWAGLPEWARRDRRLILQRLEQEATDLHWDVER